MMYLSTRKCSFIVGSVSHWRRGPWGKWTMWLSSEQHRALVDAVRRVIEGPFNPIGDVIVVGADGFTVRTLKEGKWIDGRLEKNIRIDLPTHFQGLQGQKHASVYGRNKRTGEFVVVNFDGT